MACLRSNGSGEEWGGEWSWKWLQGSDEGVVMVLFTGAVKELVRAVAIRAAMLSRVSYTGLPHDRDLAKSLITLESGLEAAVIITQ